MPETNAAASPATPAPGDLVFVRSRRWLVEDVTAPGEAGESPIVHLACADDDAQGQLLDVFWNYEIDGRVLAAEGWAEIGSRGFDPRRRFAAFLHTMRWGCVTSTDPDLFQSPFRAGIKIDAYQMEPLRKALRLPRVNLFIADDTGLGKTIEAGLVARELLLRRRAKSIVVAAPPAVLEQWKAELEDRFGLIFEILDRAYLTQIRREHGFGMNPWRTHSRFLVSHNLLADPSYADPLREWLGSFSPGSLLILDEAHHAAPSSGGRYGIESKFTRAVRDLSNRFEHRLFLSATPHNGHSNSFATLLELLDPYRFTRGVKVRPKDLDEIMVRRLKEDIRSIQGGFPERRVVRIAIDDLAADTPELVLSRLLDEYRAAREERFRTTSARAQAAAGLLVVGLQQRLLSSIEAFARSLAVHRATVERQWAQVDAERATVERQWAQVDAERATVDRPWAEADGGRTTMEMSEAHEGHAAELRVAEAALVYASSPFKPGGAALEAPGEPSAAAVLLRPPDPDDERAGWAPEELEAAEDEAVRSVTSSAEASFRRESDELGTTVGGAQGMEADRSSHRTSPTALQREVALLDQMRDIAEAARYLPDAKALRLIDWIRENLCPDLPPFGVSSRGPAAAWKPRRVLIFTESREGTKRWLRTILEQAIASTDRAEERIAVIDGLTAGPHRREIQRRFNTDPADDPLRILLATDAAREGLNFQAHCTDLFHFDLPWNPGRIEQRNGRIDRKLQPADEVNCHYFVLTQRVEDRVLEVLVRKTETIKRELGSLSKVIDDDIERRLRTGIRHSQADELARELEGADLDAERKRIVEEELEEARDRQADLKAQVERCRTLLDASRNWTAFGPEAFRGALSAALDMMGAPELEPGPIVHGQATWTFPALDGRWAADPSWSATLDSLRGPRPRTKRVLEWRLEAPIRPVVFADSGVLNEETVHLHLEQRVAQRLLARFASQGFVYHDLSRACLAQTQDSIPRVILLGRLSLYGRHAERLHEEVVVLAARWSEPGERKGPLVPYGREAEAKTMDLLERALSAPQNPDPAPAIQQKLLAGAARDAEELRAALEGRFTDLAKSAAERLAKRGATESAALVGILQNQRTRVQAQLDKHSDDAVRQLTLHFSEDEKRQIEADIRAWRLRLDQFDRDLAAEPDRIRDFYQVRAERREPVGLVYLWPDTN